MDSSDSDIPDVSTTLDIQPYQFEPLVNEENHEEEQNSTSESSDIEDISQTVDRLVNTDLCECGNCEPMTTAEECICCAGLSAVSFHMQPDDLQCITEHDICIANCLNRHVLYVSMYECMENVAPFDDNEAINEKYRFMAYRRLFSGYGTDWVDITGQFYQLVWSGKSERHFHQKNIVVSNMQLYELDIKLK